MDVMESLRNKEEVLWLNPNLQSVEPASKIDGYGYVYMKAAQNRFMRFLPYIASAFPETAAKKGVIESEIIELPKMKEWLNENGANLQGRLFLKDDARLPIAGSVKARGGIHEVLKLAEHLAQKEGLLLPTEDYGKLDSDEFRQFFSQYTVQVGSTGNLGVSIGRMSARLGFKAVVHMSSDAKQWKKDLLRSEGVIVKEYDGDYSHAVAEGRALSDADEKSHFVDDENSQDLFFGYSTAAMRLSVQLRKLGIPVDVNHPLFVYLPCGVGGAPGGISFGLKEVFGSNVHCFFAEPVEAPCVTLGMASGKHEKICVQDVGLSGVTIADGLAVGRSSGFVCNMMETILSGAFTVGDERLTEYQKALKALTGIRLEPSACAGFLGAACIERAENMEPVDSKEAVSAVDKCGLQWKNYLESHALVDKMANATHIVWGTGGGLMPEDL